MRRAVERVIREPALIVEKPPEVEVKSRLTEEEVESFKEGWRRMEEEVARAQRSCSCGPVRV